MKKVLYSRDKRSCSRSLRDIVFVELPDIGKTPEAEEESAIVESVKAASDVYSPLSGEVIEVNEKLYEPEIINGSPMKRAGSSR